MNQVAPKTIPGVDASVRLRRGSGVPAQSWVAYPIVAAIALALLALSISRHPFLNEDGALYLLVADRIGALGLGAAMQIFDRPFYSALIAAVHALTGLELRWSAYLLNTLFVVVIALAFVDFSRLLYDDARILPWAALLLLAHPRLNNYFSYIVRDIGYWAFLLSSWCFLLRHLHSSRWRTLAGWAGCCVLAACFKPEGITFGIVLPLAILFNDGSWRSRIVRTAAAYAMLLAPLLPAIMWQSQDSLTQVLCCLHERPLASLQGVPREFLAASERYTTVVLTPDLRDLAPLSLAGGLMTLLLAKILNAFGALQLLLVICAGRFGVLPVAAGRRAAYSLMLAVAVLLPALFLAYQRLLDNRYLMLICFLLLVPAARGLQALVARLRTGGGAGLVGLLLVFAAFFADFSLGLNKSKPYMQDCYRWIQENVAADVRLFTNDRQFAAAALGGAWDSQEVDSATPLIEAKQAPIDEDRLWIIHMHRSQPALIDGMRFYEPKLQRMATFKGERGEEIGIYRPLLPGALKNAAQPLP
jgi:Dolichyl-phosphate-mannose-protein mannosyltransferase